MTDLVERHAAAGTKSKRPPRTARTGLNGTRSFEAGKGPFFTWTHVNGDGALFARGAPSAEFYPRGGRYLGRVDHFAKTRKRAAGSRPAASASAAASASPAVPPRAPAARRSAAARAALVGSQPDRWLRDCWQAERSRPPGWPRAERLAGAAR